MRIENYAILAPFYVGFGTAQNKCISKERLIKGFGRDSDSCRYCNSLAVHVQLHWSEHQGMRTHAQLRSAATETKSSQPLCGSKMSILSSEDEYSRDPVQVQSSTRAMLTITSNADEPLYGVIKLDMESNHRADTKDSRSLSSHRVL